MGVLETNETNWRIYVREGIEPSCKGLGKKLLNGD